jgi:hypothetical protein
MDRQDAVVTVFENRSRRRGPRELAVALVARDENVVRPSPQRYSLEVVEKPARIGRRVRPQDERALGVTWIDR